MYDIAAKRVLVSRDVKFYEDQFPYRTLSAQENASTPLPMVIPDDTVHPIATRDNDEEVQSDGIVQTPTMEPMSIDSAP